ncbi:hypothetical protein M407DRAFT_242625 [Tulasnella calospora MUT 4182]|uniref:Uncharacterized protein n=1 Tax=Tulasnella calospora MUT 4182 TaxID=1051891 RepID=A0A0C3QE68_9AGAM|nr:hypothetical protein M407DRAFT_242625 [Tulasnella calospora MUT 4182]
MKFLTSTIAIVATLLTSTATARPTIRAPGADNIVLINSESDYCMVFPKFPGMDIGASEYPGGTQTFCTNPTDSSLQGTIPAGFFRNVAYVQGTGDSGQSYVQLTGCINPGLIDRLNPADAGGQYDSNGGDTGEGNPIGSQCEGYNSYVELIEPAGNRACIRCCNDPADCPLTMDTSGCAAVIPGNYFDC